MSKKIISIILVVIFVFSLAGCVGNNAIQTTSEETGQPSSNGAKQPSTSGDVEPVRILAGGRLSGADAESVRQDTLGVEAAAKWVNSHGGIKSLGGAKIEVTKVDVTSDPANSALAMERALQSTKDVIALIGPCESASQRPFLETIERSKIIDLAGTNSNQEIADSGYEYFFQGAPKGVEYSKAQVGFLKRLAEYLEKPLSEMRVGILYVNSTWGEDVASESAALCEEAGINVVVNESYPLGVTDVAPLVAKLQNNNVDVLFPASQALDTKLIIQTMKAINYSPVIIGSGSGFLWNTLYEDLGEDANGIFSAGAWNWDSECCRAATTYWNEVVPWFEDEYGEFIHEQTGVTFAQTMLLVQAIENCGSRDTTVIRDELRKLTSDN